MVVTGSNLKPFFLLCILQGFSFFWSSLDLSFQDTFSLINFVSFKFIGELAGLCFVCFSFVVFSSIQTFWILLLPLFIVVFMFFLTFQTFTYKKQNFLFYPSTDISLCLIFVVLVFSVCELLQDCFDVFIPKKNKLTWSGFHCSISLKSFWDWNLIWSFVVSVFGF